MSKTASAIVTSKLLIVILLSWGMPTSAPLGADISPKAGRPAVSTQGFDLRNVALADPKATPETASLFAYLRNVSKKHMLFGHQVTTGLGFSVSKRDGTQSDVYQAVGAFPAVYGWDTLTITGQGETEYDPTLLMKAAHKSGGINTLSAHMFNFVSGANFWDTTLVVPKILPGGSHNDAFRKYLDKVADFANNLKDDEGNLIPIIFRPFHENTGNWFWWGAAFCSVDEYKLLFRYTVEYLRDVKGVHSFLYAYSPAAHYEDEDDFLKRYPGDDYVDILAVDGYDQDLVGNWIDKFMKDAKIVSSLAVKRGKVAAIAETGASSNGLLKEKNPNPDWYTGRLLGAFKRDAEARGIAYVMVWRNASTSQFWIPYRNHPQFGNHEMLNDFVAFFNDDFPVFNDRLSGVYSLKVKRTKSKPSTYVAFPMANEKVTGEYLVRVKADGRGAGVQNVTVTVPRAGKLKTTLKDGYYTARWDTSKEVADEELTIVAQARYRGGAVQTAKVVVTPVSKENVGSESTDPAVVDTFDSYGGSDSSLAEKYARAMSGNTIRLSLDKTSKSSGGYGLKYHYGMGTPDYAGATRRLPNVDWSKYGQIEFWLKPDDKGQNLVIQITAGGKEFEKWLPVKDLKEGLVKVPFSDLKRPRWAQDKDIPIDLTSLKSVSALSIYVNAEPSSNSGPFESDLYFDDIKVSGTPDSAISAYAPGAGPIESGILSDFEAADHGWTGGEGIPPSAPPAKADDWGSHGKSSLKAGIELKAGGKYYVAKVGDVNLATKKVLRADVKHAPEGTFEKPMTAKLALKIGDAWKWTDGGAQPIAGDKATTILLDLTKIQNLDKTKEIGVEFFCSSCSGTSAIYIDNVAVE